ncbi:hypothetical protein BGX38DRAFT_605906 [Terfezia claveryi]|nr:hypothetical protein BGX38DRAFT_605906 [Terfezia claveryi]
MTYKGDIGLAWLWHLTSCPTTTVTFKILQQRLGLNSPQLSRSPAVYHTMNDFKLCQDNTRLLPEHSEDESSGSFTPGSSSEWEDEESEDDIRLGYYYLPGLPPPHRAPPMQLSSRVPMVKGKAKSITIDKGEKKKADEVVSTATQGNAA